MKPKPQTVKIIQITTTFCENYSNEIQTFGLGDDDNVYYWQNNVFGEKSL